MSRLRAVLTAVLVLLLVGSVQTSWAAAGVGAGPAAGVPGVPAAGSPEPGSEPAGSGGGLGPVGSAVVASAVRPGVAGGVGEPAGRVWPAERRVRELSE